MRPLTRNRLIATALAVVVILGIALAVRRCGSGGAGAQKAPAEQAKHLVETSDLLAHLDAYERFADRFEGVAQTIDLLDNFHTLAELFSGVPWWKTGLKKIGRELAADLIQSVIDKVHLVSATKESLAGLRTYNVRFRDALLSVGEGPAAEREVASIAAEGSTLLSPLVSLLEHLEEWAQKASIALAGAEDWVLVGDAVAKLREVTAERAVRKATALRGQLRQDRETLAAIFAATEPVDP